MKVEDVVELVPGTSVSRIRKVEDAQSYYIYNQTAFNDDYDLAVPAIKDYKTISTDKVTNVVFTEVGDLIYNISNAQIAVVSEHHANFILPYNYSKVVVKDFEKLNPSYFEYWVNTSQDFLKKTEEHIKMNGMRRISVNQLKQVDMTLPELDYQKKIGELQHSMNIVMSLKKRRNVLINKLIEQTLEQERR